MEEEHGAAMAVEEEEGGGMEEESKQERKQSSYTYWVRSVMEGAAPAAVPRKMSEVEIAKKGPAHLGSLWNQGGTWEETCLNGWAWGRVKELIQSVGPVEFADGKAHVMEVSSCTGDATLVTVRQKKRVGYSFEITMQYKGEVLTDGEKVDLEGTMKVPEACYGELDDIQLEVSVNQSQIADSMQRSRVSQALVTTFLPAIRGKLEQFESELKQR